MNGQSTIELSHLDHIVPVRLYLLSIDILQLDIVAADDHIRVRIQRSGSGEAECVSQLSAIGSYFVSEELWWQIPIECLAPSLVEAIEIDGTVIDLSIKGYLMRSLGTQCTCGCVGGL